MSGRPGRGLGSVRRRVGWGMADQAISSLTNFALSAVVANLVGVDEFGAFGIAFIVYLLAIGASRAVSSEPLLVRYSGEIDDRFRRAVTRSTGSAFVVGALSGVVVVAIGVVLGGPDRDALVPLGILLVPLLVQDAYRHAFIAGGRADRAVENEIVWAIGQVIGFAIVLLAPGSPPLWALVAAWAGGAALAALTAAIRLRCTPAPHLARRWWAEHRDVAPRFGLEFFARAGARQSTVFAVRGIVGLAGVAAIRGGQVLFGPVNVFLLGAPMVLVPEAVRARRRSTAALRRLTIRASMLLVGLAIVAGAAGMLLPDSIGELVLGDTWAEAKPLIPAQALLLASVAANSGTIAGIRALRDPARTFRVRLALIPIILGGGTIGAIVGGAAGSVVGLAIGNWIGAAMFALQFRRALSEEEREDADPDLDGLSPPPRPLPPPPPASWGPPTRPAVG